MALIWVLACILLSAFFSGMEIAFVSANRFKIEIDKKRGNRTAIIIANFNDNPGKFITTMLIGNNIALVVYGMLMAVILEPAIEALIGSNAISILLIQTVISTIIILVTAEFLPKALFRLDPNRMLTLFAFPAQLIFFVLKPIVWLISLFSEKLLGNLLKTRTQEEETTFGHTDLDHYVQEYSGNLDQAEEENEVKIFKNALSFTEVKVRECMVPRTEIIATDIDADLENVRKTFIETGLSKILIYRDNIDNLIGYVHSFEMFRNPKNIKSIVRPIGIVPETMNAKDLLTLFGQQQRSVAVVVDEFGGTSGMITVEDIIEEIFGEIEDEHDSEEFTEEELGENMFRFSARIEIDYLNNKFNLELPESEEYETLGGHIISEFQSIPKKGEVISIGQFKFTILKADNTKIEEVKLEIIEV
jgi:CBS domain containing-hemolysin-like protein